jgi:hypothetical protein
MCKPALDFHSLVLSKGASGFEHALAAVKVLALAEMTSQSVALGIFHC